MTFARESKHDFHRCARVRDFRFLRLRAGTGNELEVNVLADTFEYGFEWSNGWRGRGGRGELGRGRGRGRGRDVNDGWKMDQLGYMPHRVLQ